MGKMEIGVIIAIMLLGFSTHNGKAEIYMVMIEGEPVISYKGGVMGFEATAVDSDSDEKIDVTRYWNLFADLVGASKSMFRSTLSFFFLMFW